jgi:hypothetical protein
MTTPASAVENEPSPAIHTTVAAKSFRDGHHSFTKPSLGRHDTVLSGERIRGPPNEETVAMLLHCDTPRLAGTRHAGTRLASIRTFTAPMRCPHCGDPMIAPEMSEFVVGGEIRHHWQCDSCGLSSTTMFLAAAGKGQDPWNR